MELTTEPPPSAQDLREKLGAVQELRAVQENEPARGKPFPMPPNDVPPDAGLQCCGRAPLTARVRSLAYHFQSRAEQDARHFHQLDELGGLLEKHPDVARILELLEVTQP
jgi:hypothetical protein